MDDRLGHDTEPRMTELAPEPASTTTTNTSTWDAAFAALKARFPKAKDSIVFCIHASQANPAIALDDLKAQAAMHGIRVTAASVTAAQRLLSPEPARPPRTARVEMSEPTPAASSARPQRRTRTPSGELDAEAMIRGVVGQIQAESNAELESLRAAVRKAIAVLQAAVGS